jgi:hypothetical protein
MLLSWVVWEGRCRRPRLDHRDRPPVSTRRHPQAHVHHAQEGPGEGVARGVRRRDDLGQEDARPVQWKVGECLEHPLEEECRHFERDILIEEVGQGIHEDHEADGVGGEQRRKAFTQEGRELPAGERPRQVDAPEDAVRGDAAGPRDGDDRRNLKGQVSIDQGNRAPGGDRSRGTAEGHPVNRCGSPQPDRACLWGNRRHGA